MATTHARTPTLKGGIDPTGIHAVEFDRRATQFQRSHAPRHATSARRVRRSRRPLTGPLLVTTFLAAVAVLACRRRA